MAVAAKFGKNASSGRQSLAVSRTYRALLGIANLHLPLMVLVLFAASSQAANRFGHGGNADDFVPSRSITDPCLKLHWRFLVDPNHPQWPARLVLIENRSPRKPSASVDTPPGGTPVDLRLLHREQDLAADSFNRKGQQPVLSEQEPAAANAASSPVVVLAGDRVLVDQESQWVHASFEARALTPAAVGQTLQVRLRSGPGSDSFADGPLVLVRVVSAGHTRWIAQAVRSKTAWGNDESGAQP